MNDRFLGSSLIMKKQVLILLTTLFIAPAVWAEPYTKFGDPDCGAWVKNQTTRERAWLMGKLTGMNHVFVILGTNNKKKDPLNELDSANQAFVWMDNYCRKNPLKSVGDGAIDLFIELIEK